MPSWWWVNEGTGDGWWTPLTTASSTASAATTIYYPIASANIASIYQTSTTLNYPNYVQQMLLSQQAAMMMHHSMNADQMAAQAQAAQMAAQRDHYRSNHYAEVLAQERIARRRALDERRHNGEAARRARELLERHLTQEQLDSLRANKFFIVEGGRTRTRYRVNDEGHLVGNVAVLDAGGRVQHRLCAHCDTFRVPMGDQLLAQKLMLEGDEETFLRLANRHAA